MMFNILSELSNKWVTHHFRDLSLSLTFLIDVHAFQVFFGSAINEGDVTVELAIIKSITHQEFGFVEFLATEIDVDF